MRKLILCAAAFVGAFAVAVFALAPSDAPASERTAASASGKENERPKKSGGGRRLAVLLQPGDDYLIPQIAKRRTETWRWQRVMQRSLTPASTSAEQSRSPAYRRWVHTLWVKRATNARKQAASPPHKTQWLCIHRYEGAWNDPNPPYWGGLQMGTPFMEAFGGQLRRTKGTADRWTPLEQMWAAERAYASGLGFHPWPNTARYCGLL